MSESLKQMDKEDLVKLERLAHLLKGLSEVELETLELLLDDESYQTITRALKELEEGQGIQIDKW